MFRSFCENQRRLRSWKSESTRCNYLWRGESLEIMQGELSHVSLLTGRLGMMHRPSLVMLQLPRLLFHGLKCRLIESLVYQRENHVDYPFATCQHF